MDAKRRQCSAGHVQALRRPDIDEADLFASTELGAADHLAGPGLRAEDFTVYSPSTMSLGTSPSAAIPTTA
ncbi:hypothetical protein [Pseudodesulfovibrio methanolicus]|uniref:Uncharacterized protein n=1 Tax=Pseudodesulfovibrio methanolicus TaxID=3126690 RepID=A0ABZ2IS75_9BACT